MIQLQKKQDKKQINLMNQKNPHQRGSLAVLHNVESMGKTAMQNPIQNIFKQKQSTQNGTRETSQQRLQAQKLDRNVSLVMVPCLNCEELVSVEDIDVHSMRCTTVTKRVQAVNISINVFEEVNFKIAKLRDSLVQLINQVKMSGDVEISDNTERKMKYLCRASEISEQTLQVVTIDDKNERHLKDIECELRILSETFSGSLGVALYIERLHSLIMQKISILKKQKTKQGTTEKTQINYLNSPTSNKINQIQYQKPPSPHVNITQGREFNNPNIVFQNPIVENQSRQKQLTSLDRYPQDIKNNNFNKNQPDNLIKDNSRSLLKHDNSSQGGVVYDNSRDNLKSQFAVKRIELDQVRAEAQIYRQGTQQVQNFLNNRVLSPTYYQSPPQQLRKQDSQYNFMSPEINQNGRMTLITKFSGSNQFSRNNINIDLKSDILTQLSSSQQFEQDIYQLDDKDLRVIDQAQRAFYSKCLNYQFKLPKNHPAKRIPVSVLFKDAHNKGVPTAKWDQFIQQALNSPFMYLDQDNSDLNQKIQQQNR